MSHRAATVVGLLALAATAAPAAADPRVVYRGERATRLAASGMHAAIAAASSGACGLEPLVVGLDLGAGSLGRACGDFHDLVGIAQDDRRMTWITQEFRDVGALDQLLDSRAGHGAAPFHDLGLGYDPSDVDPGGVAYVGIAGAGGLTAALEFAYPAGTSSQVTLASARRTRVVSVPAGATAVAVGDGRAYLSTTTPGLLRRVGMRGPLTAMTLRPAPPAGARILAGGGRLVAVSPGAARVYDAATRRLTSVRRLPGTGRLAVLHGSLLLVGVPAGVVAIDLAHGRSARIVRLRRGARPVALLAACDAGVLYGRSTASRTTVRLLPWSDVPAALRP